MPSELDAPTCDTDGCDAEIVGLEDGWPNSAGRLACADCWEYWTEHGHWPDEDEDCTACDRQEGRAHA